MMSYHDTRLKQDKRRTTLWKALWKYYFQKIVRPTDVVLEMGCGYGDFINAVVAQKRIACDVWPAFLEFLADEVEGHISNLTNLNFVADNSLDFVFASNLLEHLAREHAQELLITLRSKLKAGGQICFIQPNFRYCYDSYFDDYTHISVFSHVSLADLVKTCGYQLIEVKPRFLPLTLQSRLPVIPILIWAYLKSPIKPFGKQMLIRAGRQD